MADGVRKHSVQTVLLLLATGVPWLGGCILVPIPQKTQVLAGRPVEPEQTGFITPHVTTKQMVVEHLGQPDAHWVEADLFIYRWVTSDTLLFGFLVSAADVVDIPERHALLIQFDEDQRVRRYESVQAPRTERYGSFLREWVAKEGGGTAGSPAGEKRP